MPPEQASILGCMNGKRDQLDPSMSNGSLRVPQSTIFAFLRLIGICSPSHRNITDSQQFESSA